ncbi:trypsin-like peptidase domain-containing protein [Streptomyces sp. NPDC051322]|uniref:S1C family serine protease n=1 Tax=Streptomyces sp. NPDC051322 TaxID=3154645 RepID=UPI00344DD664
MDDGTFTGTKATWWSSPAPGRPVPRAASTPPAEAATEGRAAESTPEDQAAADQAAADHAPEAISERPQGVAPLHRTQPLHAPDPYGTPPYGGPGPWAPAPPVQRPVPAPAHGTPLPPQYGHPGPGPAPAQQPVPLPAQHTAPQVPQPSQWIRYDPWGAPPPPLAPAKRRRSTVPALLVLALVAAVIGGGVGAYLERNGSITDVTLPQAARESPVRAPGSIAGIAARALPSVVTLHVRGGSEQDTGTGIILDREGHILTNNHVVEPANSSGDISVTFSGGQSAKAELVGKDSGYDLAVVKVPGVSGLTPMPLGNSDNVQVGDPVVAIGAPFDLSNTVTSGIISAKERPITAGGEKGDGSDISYVDALQTDAPINPGNSGGPLVDAQARVIGINSAIRGADNSADPEDSTSGSIGLGFAIPVNQAKRVAEQLINTGHATHPVIGVTLDMQYAGDGARVAAKANDGGPAVAAGGPGADARIKPGDVVTSVDGLRVHSGEELIVRIRAHEPGDRLSLTVRRDGRDRTVVLTLGSSDGG